MNNASSKSIDIAKKQTLEYIMRSKKLHDNMKYFGNAFDNVVNLRDSPSARYKHNSKSISISPGRGLQLDNKHYRSYHNVSPQRDGDSKGSKERHSHRMVLRDLSQNLSEKGSSKESVYISDTPDEQFKEAQANDERWNFSHPQFKVVTQVESIRKLQQDFLKEKTLQKNANHGSRIRWQDAVEDFESKKMQKQRSILAVLSDIEQAKKGAIAHEKKVAEQKLSKESKFN